jgi:beta-glucosidase
MASTFDPELVYVSSRQTALEMRAIGMHWTFAPNVEVARDQRWAG